MDSVLWHGCGDGGCWKCYPSNFTGKSIYDDMREIVLDLEGSLRLCRADIINMHTELEKAGLRTPAASASENQQKRGAPDAQESIAAIAERVKRTGEALNTAFVALYLEVNKRIVDDLRMRVSDNMKALLESQHRRDIEIRQVAATSASAREQAQQFVDSFEVLAEECDSPGELIAAALDNLPGARAALVPFVAQQLAAFAEQQTLPLRELLEAVLPIFDALTDHAWKITNSYALKQRILETLTTPMPAKANEPKI